MEQNFQTSFIPKKPIVKDRTISAQPIGILFVGSIFVLFTVLIATGGLYFYKLSLTKNITDLKSQFDLAQSDFEPSEIAELQVLDKRLSAANDILDNHVAISPIFQELEKLTMKSVRYTKFSYSDGSGPTDPISVKIEGQAVNYRSIALQSDLFSQDKSFIDPVFSNLTLDNKGDVLFELDFTVDPSFINYKQTLTAAVTPQ